MEFKSNISEGLVVVLAKVLSYVNRTIPSVQYISKDLFFKKSKGASQSQFIKLTDDNFKDMTKSRWNLITSRDVVAWANDGKSVLEGFFSEIFIYIHRRALENIPTGLRRATANRIEASASLVRDFENSQGIQLGPITRQHVKIRQARQPDGSDFIMPSDNTTRQAQYLDEMRREEGTHQIKQIMKKSAITKK